MSTFESHYTYIDIPNSNTHYKNLKFIFRNFEQNMSIELVLRLMQEGIKYKTKITQQQHFDIILQF